MATQVETAINKAKQLLGSHAYDNYCQRFVRVCYEAAGIYGNAATARGAMGKWKESSGRTNIPVGAAVYFTNSSDGHVGIYLGDDKMIHAWGSAGVIISSVDKCPKYQGWGWQGGIKPTGATVSQGEGNSPQSDKKYLGKFTVTAYCPCALCCGKWSDGITASGKTAQANHTIAVDPSVIPLGTKVMIGGKTYYAEDTGGAIKGNRIDIYFDSHRDALNFGKQMLDVYTVSGASADVESSPKKKTEKKEITKSVIKSVSGGEGVYRFTNLSSVKKDDEVWAELLIENDKIYRPITKGDITLTLERKGSPGRLKFSVIKDDTINFQEGNPVRLTVGGENVFYGYVFCKSRADDTVIDVTAYDQLRYFKNKDSYVYENKKYSELLKMIADDYNLTVGEIADTEYTIPRRVEEGSLFDILGNASDLTLIKTGKIFVLYDDFGKLTLKNTEDMISDVYIDESRLQGYDYKTSVDNDVYNKIKIAVDNEETGEREFYVFSDSESQSRWGILQDYEKMDFGTSISDINTKGQMLLRYYNVKSRELKLKNVFGVTGIRGGSSVIVNMNLGDIIVSNRMIVEKAEHKFSDGHHFMSLDLAGINRSGAMGGFR